MHNAQFVHLILDICKRCSIHLITLTYGILVSVKLKFKYFEWQIIKLLLLLPAVIFLVRELIHNTTITIAVSSRTGVADRII